MIPNGKMSAGNRVHQNGDIVPIVCEQGFDAKGSHLTCDEGVWKTAEKSFEDICKRKSTFDLYYLYKMFQS